jgi:ubiquinone biosynthesis protein
MLKIILLWYKTVAAKAATEVLTPNFEDIEIKAILKGYWLRYNSLKREIKKEPTFGGTLMVHLAAMSTAFYQELTQRGISNVKTTKYFYDIAWKVYKIMGKLSWNITRLKYQSNAERLKYATELFRAFPFSSPSYKWENILQPDSSVCFNCTKCPVAEYFETKGLSEFCVNTWCALDFPLAEMWNAKLERTNSIAGGAKLCDFKWKPNN